MNLFHTIIGQTLAPYSPSVLTTQPVTKSLSSLANILIALPYHTVELGVWTDEVIPAAGLGLVLKHDQGFYDTESIEVLEAELKKAFYNVRTRAVNDLVAVVISGKDAPLPTGF